jgi:tripartite-type tricarboxylate transporter receptor subunit TctC
MTRRCLGLLGALVLLAVLAARAEAESAVEQFYKGNQVRLIGSAGPGSGYSAWTRFIGQHLGRHLPGAPAVVVQYMGGAGGLIAANYMYSLAGRDGREIASLAREAPALSLMNAPGVRYDSLKLNWLGTPTSESNLCVVGKDAPVRTPEDLYSKELVMGTDGIGSGMHIFPVALNALVHTRFKVIDGYSDSGVVLLAIDRGEIHGACQSAETLLHARGDAIRSGQLRVVLQGGMKPNPKFPGVPFVLDLARNEEEKLALQFLYSTQTFGRPYAAPPEVPPERVAALRRAFMEMFRDQEFLAEASKLDYDVNPISGEDMTAMIGELAKTPRQVIERVSALVAPQVPK